MGMIKLLFNIFSCSYPVPRSQSVQAAARPPSLLSSSPPSLPASSPPSLKLDGKASARIITAALRREGQGRGEITPKEGGQEEGGKQGGREGGKEGGNGREQAGRAPKKRRRG
ncbi:hypothetical protein Naga_101058g2 [Nannochloropsis gaditana]|uniref:Uncharacterized protein n=1 Tax=Nannochloropsis gaditana TaxID=72520 RepID=W7TK47_9STRA|nr:hypothetical protein Naga_101058g2 [Nannochloropsis gaditana]